MWPEVRDMGPTPGSQPVLNYARILQALFEPRGIILGFRSAGFLHGGGGRLDAGPLWLGALP